MSHTLTFPSRPVVTMRFPSVEGSSAIEVTGPRCAKSVICALETEGDQSVIVPVESVSKCSAPGPTHHSGVRER